MFHFNSFKLRIQIANSNGSVRAENMKDKESNGKRKKDEISTELFRDDFFYKKPKLRLK